MFCKILMVFCGVLMFSQVINFECIAQSGPPYPVKWINQVGVSTNGSIITRTASSGSWSASGAITSNLLQSGEDGWMEFTAVYGKDYIIGMAANNLINYSEFTHSIQLTKNSNVAVAHEGAATGVSLGTFQTGDVFRISREGNVVIYYKNGSPIRTVNSGTSLALKVKATILVGGQSTPAISTSFDCQLVVHGNVHGVDAAGALGSIVLSVSGGTEPYSFQWSSGENTNLIENKSIGNFSVTILDDAGRSMTRSYSIGYKVDWINLSRVSNNDGRLTKTTNDGGWSSGAISSNLLPANTDGWIEFVGINGNYFIAGIAEDNILSYSEFSHSLLIDPQSGAATVFEGGSSTAYGTFQTGDVFRISREGSVVNYYKNGNVFRTISVSPFRELKIKACLLYVGNSTPHINSSFDTRLVVHANVRGLEGNSGVGDITLGVKGGLAPYTYQWNSGEQTSAINNKAKGAYSVTVTDAVGRIFIGNYSIGYKVNWTSLTGVTLNDGRLTKGGSSTGWTTGAFSTNLLRANADGWIEFVGINGYNFLLGFAGNNVLNYSQFTNSISIDAQSGTATVFEGAASTALGNFQTGDVFRISREGDKIKYLKNGIVLRTITVNPSLLLKVKACLFAPGNSTPYVNTSFWQSDGIVRIYYSIANGNWTTPSIWSLTENGPPSTVYPDDIDKVIIKGHEVIVDSNIKSAGIEITSVNDNTRLKVEGSMASLEVKGNIVMKREDGSSIAEVLQVQNNGKLDVK